MGGVEGFGNLLKNKRVHFIFLLLCLRVQEMVTRVGVGIIRVGRLGIGRLLRVRQVSVVGLDKILRESEEKRTESVRWRSLF